MHKLPTNKLTTLVILGISSIVVSGCSHALPFMGNPSDKPQPVCDKIVEPPQVPLTTFTFFPVAAGTKSTDGVDIKAGITEDGMAAILDNHAKLQQRDRQWLGRANAVNTCLDKETAQRQKK